MFRNLLIILTLSILAASGCSSGTDRHAPVVAVEPQRALLQEIVGDRHQVIALLANGANPETFEPTVGTRMALEEAPVYFATGLLPFEDNLRKSLSDNTEWVNTSDGIDLIYGTHGHIHAEEAHGHHAEEAHGHRHGEGQADPHIWTSFRNARIIARTMVETMSRKEPANAAYYRDNYQRLDRRLDSLDRVFTTRFAALPDSARTFAVWHPSLSYFARDYGLTQISVGFENKEMSPRHLAEVAEEAREHHVSVFFFQKEYDSRQAETLNRAMSTRLVTINPLGYAWEKELSTVTDVLVPPINTAAPADNAGTRANNTVK